MSSHREGVSKLPEPPEITRQPKLYAYQRIGIPVLAILPVLALVGVFGVSVRQDSVDSGNFAVTVEYLERTRLGQPGAMTVEIANGSESEVENVEVVVSRDYIESFQDLAFTPSDVKVEEDVYKVALEPIPAGVTAVVSIEMKPDRYWRRDGELVVAGLGDEEIRVPLSTLVFP